MVKPIEDQKAPEDVPAPTPAAEAPKSEIKDITFDGYAFKLDMELLDDVELLEMIDAIENQSKPGVIIQLLRNLIGDDGYDEMKAYFVKKDGRFKMSKLSSVYQAIFEDFDPKGQPY